MGRLNEAAEDSQVAALELGPEQASSHGSLSVRATMAVTHVRDFLMERKVGGCRNPDEDSSRQARVHRSQPGGSEVVHWAVISAARRHYFAGYRLYRVCKLEYGWVVVVEDNSEVEDRKDGVVEVRLWEAVCGRSHRDKAKVLDSTAVASGHSVEQGGGSCVNVVRRLAACAAVEADRMLQASRA